MKVIIVGATGLIGRRLTDGLLRRGHEVVAVSRGGESVADAPGVAWDPAAGPFPQGVMDGADAVVNLAGAGIGDGKWTRERKRLIRDSRVAATRGVVDALAAEGAPRVLVNASAIGFYGTGEDTCTEASPPGRDFLAETCVAWEAEATRAAESGVRVVLARTGIVLAPEGGALKKQLPLYRAGLGGPLAGGHQWQSWIHVDDVVGLMVFALERGDVSGPLNLTAPEPVRQKRFAKALGKAVHRPAWVWTPGFGLKLMLGEMATLALDGQRVEPVRALEAGYDFRFTDVETALRDVLA